MARRRVSLSFVALVACAVLVVTLRAEGQTRAVVPPNLQALEQKMAQIRFKTARISARVGLGELGPAGGGAELGVEVKGARGGFLSSTLGVFRLLPPEGTASTKIEILGLKPSERTPVGSTTSTERVIGNTIYTYTPALERYDGGRPWLRSKQPSPPPDGQSAGFPGLSDSFAPTLSVADARSGHAAPFAKLIEDVNRALSVQEVGPVTVDGQQTTEFTVSSSLESLLSSKQLAAFTKATSTLGALLSPSESPKQRGETKRHREEAANKLGLAPVELELFIAPNGLPVRMITVLGKRSAGIGAEQDILALEVPVHVHAPPASKTISQAQLRKLRVRRVCGIVAVHTASNAQPAICPRSPSNRAPQGHQGHTAR